MPFLETPSAARSGGVLGYENRMSFVGRLLPVVGRPSRSQALLDERPSVLENQRQALLLEVAQPRTMQPKSSPEAGRRESLEEHIQVRQL